MSALLDEFREALAGDDVAEVMGLEPLVTEEAAEDWEVGWALVRAYDELGVPPEQRAVSILDVIFARREAGRDG